MDSELTSADLAALAALPEKRRRAIVALIRKILAPLPPRPSRRPSPRGEK
jgi:hypothetical protein